MTYVSTYFVISMADAKRFLGFTTSNVADEDLLGHLIEAVSDYIEQQTQRKIVERALTEYYTGNGTDCLLLRSFPVASSPVIDIREDGQYVFGTDTKLDTTDYTLDEETGELFKVNGGTWTTARRAIKIVYTAGWTQATVPKLLRTAAYLILGAIWKARSMRSWGETSRSAGSGSVAFADEIIPPVAKDILNTYRSHR
jgi:hypothetical protein